MTSNEFADGNIVISRDHVPPAAYAAIYHKITGKTEKFVKTTDGGFRLSPTNIEHLDALLTQSLNQYSLKGFATSCTISLKEDSTYSFSDITKFLSHNFTPLSP